MLVGGTNLFTLSFMQICEKILFCIKSIIMPQECTHFVRTVDTAQLLLPIFAACPIVKCVSFVTIAYCLSMWITVSTQ